MRGEFGICSGQDDETPFERIPVTDFATLLTDNPGLAVALIVAAGFAGWIDAVVGGGGLVLIPVLLIAFPNAVPATALGTNKAVAVWGTLSASITYLRRTRVPLKFLAAAVPIALVFSGLGAAAAAAISTDWMRPMVLVLLLAVGLWVALRPGFGSGDATPLRRAGVAGGLCAAGAISFYDGIFGPGTGTFLIMAFTALVTGDFLRSAAMSKVVNLATNIGALLVFGAGGHIVWLLALVLAIANVIGAQVGARMAINRGSGFVRIVLLVVVVAMVGKLAYDMIAA